MKFLVDHFDRAYVLCQLLSVVCEEPELPNRSRSLNQVTVRLNNSTRMMMSKCFLSADANDATPTASSLIVRLLKSHYS